MSDLIKILNSLGMKNEIGWSNGGFYNPSDVKEILGKYSVEQYMLDMLEKLDIMMDPAKMNEFLHCLNVGFDSAELVEQVMNDSKAKEKLGITRFPEDYIHAALISGIFHDMILNFKGDALEEATPISRIKSVVAPEELQKLKNVQYIKDEIGDDLRGAILVNRYSAQHSFGNNIQNALNLAIGALLAGSGLKVKEKGVNLLGKFNPYKILDAIWYHDGNYPIRGHGNGKSLISERVKLYTDGKVDIDVVGQGLNKILKYSEESPGWEERCSSADIGFLEKWISKKAGEFMQAIRGTQTYDFVIEDLSVRQRGKRSLKSPLFWTAANELEKYLEEIEDVPELKATFSREIENLYRRYEALNKYRGG